MPRYPDDEEGFGPEVKLGSTSKRAAQEELAQALKNTGAKPVNAPPAPRTSRTSQGLRDILFDEIDSLRNGDGDPTKALAIANIAKQILNTARVELDFQRVMKAAEGDGAPITLGNLKLGTDPADAPSAKRIATER